MTRAAARRGGRYVQVGIAGQEVPFALDTVLYQELTVTSGFASTPQSWRRALALMASGQVDLDPLVTGSSLLQHRGRYQDCAGAWLTEQAVVRPAHRATGGPPAGAAILEQ